MTGETAFNISANAAIPSSSGSDASESYNAVAWPNDQYAQVLIPVVGTGALTTGTGVALRMSTTARTYYRIVVASSGTEIAKFVAGVYTSLATDATVWANGDTAYASAVGTTLQVRRNGSNLLSTTDSAIASGRAGITHSSTSQVGVNLDNWEGGDFAAPLGVVIFFAFRWLPLVLSRMMAAFTALVHYNLSNQFGQRQVVPGPM